MTTAFAVYEMSPESEIGTTHRGGPCADGGLERLNSPALRGFWRSVRWNDGLGIKRKSYATRN
jgi:hypothetical protein